MLRLPGGTTLEVQPLHPDHDAERDALVRTLPGGTVFHLSHWRRFVSAVYGLAAHDVGAWRGGRLVGVLPMMRCPTLGAGERLVSMPFAVYGGPLSAEEEVRAALVRSASALADELGVRHLELRCRDEPGLDLPGSDLYRTFVRDLPARPEDVLARMPKKARAEARKARARHGLELTEGLWYLDDLERLVLLNKRALGSPAWTREHFVGLLESLSGEVFVHVVHKESEPVAAVMSFGFGDRLMAYYSGTEPGADRALGASNFLYLSLQEWAVARGFRSFDFGRSRKDTGAMRFKVHQGFEPSPLYYRYHLVKDRALPSFTPSNPRTAALRAVWSRLPLWAARRLTRGLAPRLA